MLNRFLAVPSLKSGNQVSDVLHVLLSVFITLSTSGQKVFSRSNSNRVLVNKQTQQHKDNGAIGIGGSETEELTQFKWGGRG